MKPPRTAPLVRLALAPSLLALTLLLVLLLLGPPLAGQQPPSWQRGIKVDQVYAAGELDEVNLLNGNLIVSLPIGPSYPVGGVADYRLQLVYNSKAWDHLEAYYQGRPYTRVVPDELSNAGLGWSLSLGQLYGPGRLASSPAFNWTYVGADGTEHQFSTALGAPSPPGTTDPCVGTCYSRDGAYLRMRVLSATQRVVEMPNGSYQTFTDFAPAGGKSDWRLTAINDRFSDGLRDLAISYSPDGNTWTLTDKHDRVQRVVFRPDATGWYGRLLDHVELSQFGGSGLPAVYTFNYLPTATVDLPCNNNLPFWTEVDVQLLSSVTLPDGTSHRFTYFTPEQPASCHARGMLASMTLPTLGGIRWTYRDHTLPTQGCSLLEWHRNSAAVATRELFDQADGAMGTWTYAALLSASPLDPTYHCESGQTFRPPPEELKVTVTTPLLDRHVHYFSVWPGAEFPFETPALANEYGLPYSRIQPPDATGNRFLSSQVFDCDASGGSCALQRSTYLRFERDAQPVCSVPFDGGCLETNRRKASERVVYHDDGGRWADQDWTDWDGFGHYRRVTTGGNFTAGNVRSVYTAFNPGNVLPGSAWVLDTWTERTTTEGTAAKEERCYDAATGALLRQRLLQFGAVRSANDLVRVLEYDGAGNLTRQRDYGTDAGSLQTTGSLCSMPLPAERYRLEHGYQFGVRATSRFYEANGTPLSFLSLDRTIDRGSGLPSAVRDSAGLQVDLEHDWAGRLTWEKPQAGQGAWVEYAYTAASTGNLNARVDIRRRVNGSRTGAIRSQEKVRFDGLGRVWREQKLMPGGFWNLRDTTYNGLGWPTSVSEWMAGSPDKKTEYLEYDPFGRARRIRPPDGASHDLTFDYDGVRLLARSTPIGTTWDAEAAQVLETSVTVYEERDRQGRLIRVTDPAGPLGGLMATTYEYDVGGRLKKVCQNAVGATCTQARTFQYDDLGFLRAEIHPEKGAAGNGTVTYSGYDPLGNAGRIVDGGSDLTYLYDRAGRLTEVRETGGAQRPFKRFTFGTGQTAGNWDNGRVRTAERYNYVAAGTIPFTFRLEETYTYSGRDGRISRRDTRVWNGAVNTDHVYQSWTWDELGNLATQGYPECSTCGLAAPRTVTYGYTEGLLSSVAGYASAITYHGNGVDDLQTNDPSYLQRPAEVLARRSGVDLWRSGTYSWDGAGNVTQIGPWWFEYHPVRRLKTATLFDGPTGGGTEHQQRYTYDAFENLSSVSTRIGSGSTVVRNVPVSSSTNRLTGAVGYDAQGNLTGWNGQAYGYDPLGSVWRVALPDQEWVHLYSADDERLVSFKLGGETRFAVRDLGNRLVRELVRQGSTWQVDRDYVYRGSKLLAAETPAGVRHFHLDALGTPRLITNGAGQPVAYHAYFPYGEEVTNPLQDSEAMRFLGERRDLHTHGGSNPGADDLDYFHARYSNPQLGRFLSPDPIVGMAVNPRSWNRYAYAQANPLNRTDRTGMVLDTVVDVAFIAYDIYDICHSYQTTGTVSGTQWMALGADVVGALVPFATGGGAAVRTAAHADDALDVARGLDHSTDAAKVSDNVQPTSTVAQVVKSAVREQAEKIAGGHAYDKHVVQQAEFPGVTSKAQFADVVEGVMTSPTHQRNLSNGRKAFYDQNSNTLVIEHPSHPDGGTAFRPTAGMQYYLGLN